MRQGGTVRLAACVAVAGLILAGCSSGTVAADRAHTGTATATPVDGIQTVTVTTGNDLRFHPSTIVVHPGKVRIVLRNTAAVGSGPPHDLVVDGLPGGVGYINAGQSGSWEFVAPAPGQYTFVCQLHVEQGQTGTLVVEG